jgi:hypothetical protein
MAISMRGRSVTGTSAERELMKVHRIRRVASIVLCKSFEWVKGPLVIHSFKD